MFHIEIASSLKFFRALLVVFPNFLANICSVCPFVWILSSFLSTKLLNKYKFGICVAGGQAKTVMFVQLNPDVNSYSESLSTLKFAERVSGVELGAARSTKEGRDVRELMDQVSMSHLDLHCNCLNKNQNRVPVFRWHL